MNTLVEQCENWLRNKYHDVLGLSFSNNNQVRLRYISSSSLTNEVTKTDAQGLVIEDADVAWLLFLLPYEPTSLEKQVNQAIGLRSRLLSESNYTGKTDAADIEDQHSSWRVGLIWFVGSEKWNDWQYQILELRHESGITEEISFDAIRVENGNASIALETHGLARLLLHTRALLQQTASEAETWLSANQQVSTELKNFGKRFKTNLASSFAQAIEAKAHAYKPKNKPSAPDKARLFGRFHVKNFRNLEDFEIIPETTKNIEAQTIVVCGPNGTGKSSFAEAVSLAAFNTSPRLEMFLNDRDIQRKTPDVYLADYLTPYKNPKNEPNFSAWGKSGAKFNLLDSGLSGQRFSGVVLSQSDSIGFTELSRTELAAQVIIGYSDLADDLSSWLDIEDSRAKESKLSFTRKHSLNAAITVSKTAYKKLAETLLANQLPRPSPEFLAWLEFMGRLSDENGIHASKLWSDWRNQQGGGVVRLAEAMAKLQEHTASLSQLTLEIREGLNVFDQLANESRDFREKVELQITDIRDQLDLSLIQIESWGQWLSSQTDNKVAKSEDSQNLEAEIAALSKERVELEKQVKLLRSRIILLDQAKQFLTAHWSVEHRTTCPVCDSDLSQRQGIEAVVSTIQAETDTTIQALQVRHLEMQRRQNDLDARLKASGLNMCPLAIEDQDRLKKWLTPLLPLNTEFLLGLVNQKIREKLKGDLIRMKSLPESPKPHSDSMQEAQRLAENFITLSQEADRALEAPQAIGEVRKAFETSMEKVLTRHLPSTLGRVWNEITLALTAASWLLPERPELTLEQRGKHLSIRVRGNGGYIRYIYNAAELHVLGLAWFFTYHVARKRFEEAWMLLDDPAQEMDQTSFRELVRFWETMMRLHNRKSIPLTMIMALHQEERALDVARATNGQLYILGWQKKQEDLNVRPSVKRVVLLAPYFHPLKPETLFQHSADPAGAGETAKA